MAGDKHRGKPDSEAKNQHHAPGLKKKLAWFAAIWVAGVLGLLVVAMLIRFALNA